LSFHMFVLVISHVRTCHLHVRTCHFTRSYLSFHMFVLVISHVRTCHLHVCTCHLILRLTLNKSVFKEYR